MSKTARLVWVLIDRDDYPFAVFDTEEMAIARADQVGRQRRERSSLAFKRGVSEERQIEYFAPAVCELEINAAGEPNH